MVPRENKNNAYAKFGGINKEYYGIFRNGQLFSSFRPLIKCANPTQLWNVWLSKLSNQNHAAFCAAKSVGSNGYFLLLIFLRPKMK